MTKDDCYAILARKGLKSGQARLLADEFFRLVADEIRQGQTVSLKNFVTFSVRHKKEIRIMNNRMKKEMLIPAHKVVRTKFSRLLKNLVVKNTKTENAKEPEI